MAAGSFAVASSNKYISCTCWWSSTANTNGNYSTVNFELRASRTNSGYTTYGTGSGTCNINGTEVNFNITSDKKITQNSNTLLGSGSVTVYHNDDGSKSITISVGASIQGAGLTLGTTNATVTLDTIARASTPTLNGSVFTITEANSNFMRIYTNRKSSSFSHHVYYSFNGSGEIGLTSGVTDYYDWYFPNTLADSIPNTTSASGYIRLYTFNGGTNIGSKTVAFTMQLSDEIVPTISLTIQDAVEDAEGVSLLEKYGAYIQGQSKFKIGINASGVHGSEIKTYTITADDKTYLSNEVTTDVIAGSGVLKISASVADSRGRTASEIKEVTVLEYFQPKITELLIKRTNANGESDSSGAYLTATFSAKATQIDCNNTETAVFQVNDVKYTAEYKNVNDHTDAFSEDIRWLMSQFDVTNAQYTFPADESSSYEFTLSVSDNFTTTPKTITGGTTSKLFSFLKKGLGIAFNKVAELEGYFDVNFKTLFRQDVNFECNVKISGNKLFDVIYPIGSIYMSVNDTEPAELFGVGTWEAIHDRFLVSAGEEFEAESTGGKSVYPLRANIGAVNGDSTTLGYITGNPTGLQKARGATYIISGSGRSYSFWNHSTPVTDRDVEGEVYDTTILPPYMAVHMWKRVA